MLTSSRLTLLGLLLLGLLVASVSPAAAAGGGGGNGGAGSGASASGKVEDPQYTAGVKAIKAKAALPHYQKALAIDPKHRGAHEYIGEAYLMVGNVTKAKEHLGQLDKLCFFGCNEYSDLKKSISAYEAKK